MSDRPTPETEEAWNAVSRLPSGMYDSRVSFWAYATAMSDHSRKMERQRDELIAACEWALSELGKHTRPSPLDKAIAAAKGGEG